MNSHLSGFQPSTLSGIPAEKLRESLSQLLRHCPAGTLEAALAFRATGERSLLPILIRGVLSQHCGRNLLSEAELAIGDYHLCTDLGLDSLSLMEISLELEDLFQLHVDTSRLLTLFTLRELCELIGSELDAIPLSRELASIRRETILRMGSSDRAPLGHDREAYSIG
jgi:hypothetical protein